MKNYSCNQQNLLKQLSMPIVLCTPGTIVKIPKQHCGLVGLLNFFNDKSLSNYATAAIYMLYFKIQTNNLFLILDNEP